MEPVIAKCGYRCDLCMAFEANLKGDEDKQDISRAFETYYGCKIPVEEIKPCKGCQCSKESPDADCQIFPCVQEKGFDNCGHCDNLSCGCDKLKRRMDAVEEVLAKQDDVPQDDYERYFKPYLSREGLMKIRQLSDE